MKVVVTKGKGWHVGMVGVQFEVAYSEFVKFVGKVHYIDPEPDENGVQRYISDENCRVVEEAKEGPDTEEPESDAVNHPSHYTSGKFETIEVIEEITKNYGDGYQAYCVGNALKYLSRAPFKHDTPDEDIRKATKYLQFALGE